MNFVAIKTPEQSDLLSLHHPLAPRSPAHRSKVPAAAIGMGTSMVPS